jgi:structure-specific endonuclease subunit SLX1
VDAQIGPEIKVWLDKPRQDYEPVSHVNSEGPQARRELEVVGEGGVKGIDPTYACLRPVLEKSQMILEEDENENLACSLCRQDINPRHDLVTICPQGNCASLHHMTCLSSLFLKAGQGSSMIPGSGRCPRCKAHLSWVDLMKAMSLRIRDEKGVYKLLKSKKKVAAPSALQAAALGDARSDELDVGQFGDDDQLMGADIVDDDDSDDNGDEEEYDAGSVTSARPDTSNSSRRRAAFRATVDTKLPTVIEDSDDDVIDLLSD